MGVLVPTLSPLLMPFGPAASDGEEEPGEEGPSAEERAARAKHWVEEELVDVTDDPPPPTAPLGGAPKVQDQVSAGAAEEASS